MPRGGQCRVRTILMVMALSKEEEPKPHRISPPTGTELAPKKDTDNPKSVSTGHGLFVS